MTANKAHSTVLNTLATMGFLTNYADAMQKVAAVYRERVAKERKKHAKYHKNQPVQPIQGFWSFDTKMRAQEFDILFKNTGLEFYLNTQYAPEEGKIFMITAQPYTFMCAQSLAQAESIINSNFTDGYMPVFNTIYETEDGLELFIILYTQLFRFNPVHPS